MKKILWWLFPTSCKIIELDGRFDGFEAHESLCYSRMNEQGYSKEQIERLLA